MTKETFDKTNFKRLTQVAYNNKEYYVIAVNFRERTVSIFEPFPQLIEVNYSEIEIKN